VEAEPIIGLKISETEVDWDALIKNLDKADDLFYVKTIAIVLDLVTEIYESEEEDTPEELLSYLKEIMVKLPNIDAVNSEYQFQVYYLLSLYADAELA